MSNTRVGRFFSVFSRLLCAQAAPSVGGQAVMEGVMMRCKERLAIAVRRPDGVIVVDHRPWFSLTRRPWLTRPWIRGFPILVETMVNGIKALNYSAMQVAQSDDDAQELKPWHLVATLCVSIAMALGLFVVLPHVFTIGMTWLGLATDVEGISFHVWDGLFKFIIFISYILAISLVADIRRVFQYHGAEHKVIWAYEQGGPITASSAILHSRLHPRCGTTFLLFVLSISIFLHTVLVPLLLMAWSPESTIFKHAYIIVVKLLMMVPISAMAYELIKIAARLNGTLWGKLLSAPGMLLQMLTTHEPDQKQVEVAIAALHQVIGPEAANEIHPPEYICHAE